MAVGLGPGCSEVAAVQAVIRTPVSGEFGLPLLAKESLRRILGVAKRLPGYPLDANMFN